jgi:hypothetical protein
MESETHIALMSAAVYFRSLAEIIADDLVNVARAISSGAVQGSTLKRTVLSEFYQSVQRAVDLAVEAVGQPNAAIKDEMEIISGRVNTFAESLMSQVAAGLDARDAKSLDTVRLQTTFVDGLRQIFTLAERIARAELGR